MIKARDISNFTVELTVDLVRSWGVGLLFIQAFPRSYAQYAEQQRQISVAVEAGIPWDAYIYDYLADPTWRDGCLDGLDGGPRAPRQMWPDEEDVSPAIANWSPVDRENAIAATMEACQARGQTLSLTQEPGLYTGAWWWIPRTANSQRFSVFDLWVSDYDGNPDTNVWPSFGGWSTVRVKQYAGTQPDGTDLDVLSDEEAAELQPNDCAPIQAQRDGLISALGYIAGDALAPIAKLKKPSAKDAALLAAIRAIADQQGIQHV